MTIEKYRGSNPQPPDHQSDAHPTESPTPAYYYFKELQKKKLVHRTRMPPSEKVKRKLLTPENLKRKLLSPSRTLTETDGRPGVTLYALSTILQMAGA